MTTLNAIFSTETSPDETDNTFDDPRHRTPLVLHDRDFKSVTDAICNVGERPTTLGWKIAFAISLSMLGMLGGCIGYLILTGVGVWGNNQPASWGFPIVNFVFWVGIGHAGTLISAILFLFRQNWRTAINRFAEAMTIFAVMCAGLFPGIHVGRAWLAYWLFPIPNQMSMWPQFRSPLLWDVFAVGTYATVSVLFWYVGMVPDLATFRDRSTSKIKQIAYGIFALGWTGSAGIGIDMSGPICCLPPWRRRWCCRCIAWCPSTSPCRRFPAGIRPSSPPTSSPAPSMADLRWC